MDAVQGKKMPDWTASEDQMAWVRQCIAQAVKMHDALCSVSITGMMYRSRDFADIALINETANEIVRTLGGAIPNQPPR
jgi:hypothetical protein